MSHSMVFNLCTHFGFYNGFSICSSSYCYLLVFLLKFLFFSFFVRLFFYCPVFVCALHCTSLRCSCANMNVAECIQSSNEISTLYPSHFIRKQRENILPPPLHTQFYAHSLTHRDTAENSGRMHSCTETNAVCNMHLRAFSFVNYIFFFLFFFSMN